MIWITLFIVISTTCVPLKNLHFALNNLLLYKNVRKRMLAPLFCYKDVILEYICNKKNTLFCNFCLEYVYG